MRRINRLFTALTLIAALGSLPGATSTNSAVRRPRVEWRSTRVTDPKQYARADGSGYPFRANPHFSQPH